MLETLKIKNIAVIDQTEIPFAKGLNILSGETGAGKSIIIEAISLLLGSRASTDLVRTGCDEGIVEGLFDIGEIPWLKERLQTLGLPVEDDTLLVKRIVSKNGKHRIYVNGDLATLSTLQSLCDGLIDLCGQHEHQSLLRPGTQLDLLDRFGSLEKLRGQTGEVFAAWKKLREELNALNLNLHERSQRLDFIRFQMEELKSAELVPGEEDALQSEKILLQSSEGRIRLAEDVRNSLEDEESGAIRALRHAASRLRALTALDGTTAEWSAMLDPGIAQIEEVSLVVNRYLSQIELDPDRMDTVHARLAKLAELRRKYGSSSEEMIELLSRLESDVAKLENHEAEISRLEKEISQAADAFLGRAKQLSAKRKSIAKTLSQSVTNEVQELRMGDAMLSIQLEPAAESAGWNETGIDRIQFLVRTNKGEDAKPIGKVASGGELSRLMLAIRRVIADRGGIGVYLFDEIDAGIGGQTAFMVGRKLKSVAEHNQVICITHVPQVAAFADHHLSVQKSSAGARTVTVIAELGKKERKEEIARMLGGSNLTKKSLENAAELLANARH